ncbi:MAG: DUF6268 family outer membrane beta-barrel protein [Verrucomicrobiales bacterium]
MKLLPFLALLATAGVLSAQMADQSSQDPAADARDFLADVRPAVPALASLSYEWLDTMDFEDGSGSADISVFELRSPVFYRNFGNGTRLAVGIDYSLTDLSIDNEAIAWDGQLHALYVPLSFTHRTPGSQWFWLGQVVPGLRTDFESIDSDDFAFRTFAVAMRQFGNNLAIGFGGYFSYDVDRIFAVPGIGFTWKPNDQWLFSLIPPQLAASWMPTEDWIVSATFRPRSFVADLDEGEAGPDIASVSYGRAGISVRRRLADSPHLWLNLQAGYTLYSEVELQQDGQSLFDTDLDNGFYAGASLELLGW